MKDIALGFVVIAILAGLWLFVATPMAAWEWVEIKTGRKRFQPAPPFGWF